MKDRDGLKSIISLEHGQNKGTGRSWLLGESGKLHGQKINGIGLGTP
ncbi:MAG: hypothetical protein V1689_14750 [Pseudomonadota bacterium]